jgi:glycosyltransferase involved in cell wall biosynthesis
MQETQGLVVIEAMAAGTPVVAIQTPELSDVLREGGGRLVNPDENDFADEVIALIDDPESLRNLGMRALKVAQKYTMHSAVERLIDVYEQAIEQVSKPVIKRKLAGPIRLS